MKYYNRLLILSTLMLCMILVSCEKDQFQNHSQLPKGDPSINLLGLPSIISILDKDSVITVDFELSEASIVDLTLSISYMENGATYGEDFELPDTLIFIPAYTKSGTFDINILGDDELEGVENFTVTIGSDDDVNFNHPKTINIELNDFISDDLEIEFMWEKLIEVPDFGLASTCDNFDLDFFVYDEDGNDTENYSAATPSCPEVLVFNRIADVGTFYVTQFLYLNNFGGLGLTDKVPVSCSFTRKGVKGSSVDYIQPSDLALDLSTPDYENDNEWIELDLLKIVISESGFAVYDTDDTLVSSARKSKRVYPPNIEKSSLKNSFKLPIFNHK